MDSPPDAERQMKDYCAAVSRNIDKDFRRSVHQWADRNDGANDPAKLPDGTFVEAPLADVFVLEVLRIAFAFAFPVFRRVVLRSWMLQWSFRTPRRQNGLVVI